MAIRGVFPLLLSAIQFLPELVVSSVAWLFGLVPFLSPAVRRGRGAFRSVAVGGSGGPLGSSAVDLRCVGLSFSYGFCGDLLVPVVLQAVVACPLWCFVRCCQLFPSRASGSFIFSGPGGRLPFFRGGSCFTGLFSSLGFCL